MNTERKIKILAQITQNSFLIYLFVANLLIAPVLADTLAVRTYYPSPSAVYDNLLLVTMPHQPDPCPKEGVMYADTSKKIYFCANSSGVLEWKRLGYDGIWTMNDAGTAVYPTRTPGNPDIVPADERPDLAVGIGNSTPNFRLTLGNGVADSSIIALDKPSVANSGIYESGGITLATLPNGRVLANGTPEARFIWYPKKAAFRAGAVTGNQWADSPIAGVGGIGQYSIAFGKDSTASKDFTVVGGGNTNTAARIYGSVLGGENNSITSDLTPTHDASVIVSGNTNTSRAVFNTILGGQSNTLKLLSDFAVIGGGQNNSSSGRLSFIGGGGGSTIASGNSLGSHYTVIGGGKQNKISSINANQGIGSVILGGFNNQIESQYSFIGGGQDNVTTGPYNATADVITNANNTAWGTFNVILGGYDNQARDGRHLFIGGGRGNRVTGGPVALGTGADEKGNYNGIVGGECNVAGNEVWDDGGGKKYDYTLIASGNVCGETNGTISSSSYTQFAHVTGGRYNRALATYSYIGGGSRNTIRVPTSTILGGELNTIDGTPNAFGLNTGFIMGGRNNKITTGVASTILGGSDNWVESDYSLAMGRNIHLMPAADGTFAFGYNTALTNISVPDAFIFYSSTGATPTNIKLGIGTSAPRPDPTVAIGNASQHGVHVLGNMRIDDVGNGGALMITAPPPIASITTLKIKTAPAGGLYQVGYDLAELFETNEDVEPGDLVVMDDNDKGKLKKSTSAYDSKAVGIVSAAPAIVFEGSMLKVSPKPFEFMKGTKPPVALAGRVACKVSLENGPIEEGDLLTSSSTPGHLMKVTDVNKAFGTVVGRALESFSGDQDKSTGVIMLMVTKQ